MEALKYIPYIALILTISGVIIGAGIISTSKFGETTDQCFNSSYIYTNGECVNGSPATDMGAARVGTDGLNLSTEMYAIIASQNGQLTVAEQMPTVAIIGIMVIIISLIAGVMVYMKFFS